MSFYRNVVRPLAFLLDPEDAHHFAMMAITKGLLRTRVFDDARLHQDLFGVHFANPIGLAAGFDKNAEALAHWRQFGFGFVEIGTVTERPQPGNPKPRMKRLPLDEGLINRMGFNNDGAIEVARRLRNIEAGIPVGVNLGKNKDIDLASAPGTYQRTYEAMASTGDYFVVNVSSPNTPGLRELQDKAALTAILQAMRTVNTEKPLFVKVSPDLEPAALDELIQVAIDEKVTGLIATNTTVDRSMLARDPNFDGGLSGLPLRSLSDKVLAYLGKQCPGEMILIGVGGVMTCEDVYRKIALGAHLVQTYTGWIYYGPHMIPDFCEGLIQLMDRDGVKSLSDLRRSGLK